MILILIFFLLKKCLCATNNTFELQIDKINLKRTNLKLFNDKLSAEIKNDYKIDATDSLIKIAYILSNFLRRKIFTEIKFKDLKKSQKRISMIDQNYNKKNDDFFIRKYRGDRIIIVKEVLIKYCRTLVLFLRIYSRKSYYIMIKKYYKAFYESIKENINSNTDLAVENSLILNSIIQTINKLKSIHASSIGNACVLIISILNGRIDFIQITKLKKKILESNETKQSFLEYVEEHRKKWNSFIEENHYLLI